MEVLRRVALRYPGAQEGVACEGTSLEKRTVKAGGKAFLFLGRTDAMLKLRESLPEATRLASEQPRCCKVGAHGWVTVSSRTSEAVPVDVLERWIDESYRLLAPAKLVGSLPAGSSRERLKESGPSKGAKRPGVPKVKAPKGGRRTSRLR